MAKTTSFYAPKYWTVWLGFGLLRIASLLPFRLGVAVGNALGMLLYYAIPKRRRVAEVNVGLCFPELRAAEKQNFVKDVFRHNGVGVIETAWAYWSDPDWFRRHTEVLGREVLDQALEQGKGVILLGAHYSHLDLGGMLFSFYDKPLVTMYRAHNNPLMERLIQRGRERFGEPVERANLRSIVRSLRKNKVVWYGPDQDFGSRNSVFVPFFGQTAATVTATTKMVGFNDSPMVALSQRRKEDGSGYIIEIEPVPGFPSGDELKDAEIVNLTLEKGIRKAPTQYMWVHKRFKTQPDGEQKLYKQAGC
ncbi:LpxL/LpxP family Kdo(2)-lipid IV(A) lauroyl/palmitoleoyl acyltransferase [Neptuniibacter halophilus]|uniref:LpxL/LpxP family Kdo(2)-lipid IV(A) lauroyl/palmitoleoyl acyltransferase n=1 Tax=Neptuniibacter halophilus TaxID=651666 RepID=UPI00257456B7|nr:LpxL/LpxP family Kdo(2)-lipid IV(A) lauroyl/palmitoleoyl acyltransferase [Neptuniibacter halophilus]